MEFLGISENCYSLKSSMRKAIEPKWILGSSWQCQPEHTLSCSSLRRWTFGHLYNTLPTHGACPGPHERDLLDHDWFLKPPNAPESFPPSRGRALPLGSAPGHRIGVTCDYGETALFCIHCRNLFSYYYPTHVYTFIIVLHHIVTICLCTILGTWLP